MIARRLGLATAVSLFSLVGCLSLSTPAMAVTPPAIEEESILESAATSATLQGQINPQGSETTYRFEFGTSEAYGSSIPVPDGPVGSGSLGVTVSVHIQGLSASTAYHYRVVASVPSRSESIDGADRTFFTQPAGGALALPDARQWELVSPSNKHGSPISPISEVSLIQAAEDGDAMTYIAFGPTELEPQGNSNATQIFSTRGVNGWASKDIATPHNAATGVSIGEGYEYRFFSPDLSLALVEPQGPFTQLTPEETERTPDIRDNSTCEAMPANCYRPLVTAADLPSGLKFDPHPDRLLGEVEFAGATPDLSHIVLKTFELGLTSTPGDQGGLYEWTEGHLQLLSIAPASEGGKPVSYLASHEPPVLGSSRQDDARHAISNDGARVFWSNAFSPEQLYVRDVVKKETLRIGSGVALFQTANADGSRVFFIENANLEACDLVEVAGKLICHVTRLAPEALSVIDASEDGSSVYFVSQAALAPGAVSGGDNLYLARYDEAAWGSPKLIAVLSAEDNKDWTGGPLNDMTARVAPDGRWLAFMSQRSLTGYDNRDAVSGRPDEEVYLYSAERGKLVCASCNPTGARPVGAKYGRLKGGVVSGDRVWSPSTWLAANILGWTPYRLDEALYQSRYLSNSGRVFFNSRDALVPQDVNGTWDVYEFEPEGIGDCTASSRTFSPRAGGCVGLISGGTSPEESGFMDASGTGDDVFFMTAGHLTPEDFDTAFDIYDAHACSVAAPCSSPPVSPLPCTTGDACKAAPSPQPTIFGSPSSATFSGAGNVMVSPSRPGVSSRSLTQAQKLARALKACRTKPKRKRQSCERKARRQFPAKQSRNGKLTTKGNR
jgi:hypothetical protein